MKTIKIRFNTKYQESEGALFRWRVIIDGEENLAKTVKLLVPSTSSEDVLETGEVKFHITCQGTPEWENGSVTVLP